MTDTRQDKIRKFFESRAKAEIELQRLQEKVLGVMENNDRRVRVERQITSCDEAMTNLFAKHEQLFEMAGKNWSMSDRRWSISIVNDCHQEQATKQNVSFKDI